MLFLKTFTLAIAILTVATLTTMTIVWIGVMILDKKLINPLEFFEEKLGYVQEKELENLNKPYKCECGIVSRKYQFKGVRESICPHCESDLDRCATTVWTSNRIRGYLVEDNRKFAFAPKMTTREYLKMKKEKEEVNRLNKEMKDLEEYDNELEAYAELQMKKLKELEIKAEKIRNELNSKC